MQNTIKPIRQGAYGDQIDQTIIAFLAAQPGVEVTLREVLEHLGWTYCCSTRERTTSRLRRMIKAGAVSGRFTGGAGQRGAGQRGDSCKVYRYIRPLHEEDQPAAAPVAKSKPEPRKPISLKSLPDDVIRAVEAARSRFDPVEPLGADEFLLGLFTVTEDELFAIVDREPGVLSQVAERFLGAGAGA